VSDLWQNYGGLSKFIESVEERVIGNACPGCGMEASEFDVPQIEVVWPGEGVRPPEDAEPEPCAVCGRLDRINIRLIWPEELGSSLAR